MFKRRKKTVSGKITRLPRRSSSSGLRKLVNFTGLFLCFILLSVAAVQFFQKNELERNLQEIEQKNIEYRTRNQEMSGEIMRLHEPDYIEMLARKYLGLVKPGDRVYRIDD